MRSGRYSRYSEKGSKGYKKYDHRGSGEQLGVFTLAKLSASVFLDWLPIFPNVKYALGRILRFALLSHMNLI